MEIFQNNARRQSRFAFKGIVIYSLSATIHEIKTWGRLNISLRGHQDSGPIDTTCSPETINFSQGNVRALIQKTAIRNETLKTHPAHGPKNASYLSPRVQNHLIIGQSICNAQAAIKQSI